VDPDFPLSSDALPGAARQGDQLEQAPDLSVVIHRTQTTAPPPPPLSRVQLSARVGAVGHSDGGITVLGLAANACCADSRIAAVVSLAGGLAAFPGAWSTPAAPPTLVVHGDADTVNPISSSRTIYSAA